MLRAQGFRSLKFRYKMVEHYHGGLKCFLFGFEVGSFRGFGIQHLTTFGDLALGEGGFRGFCEGVWGFAGGGGWG